MTQSNISIIGKSHLLSGKPIQDSSTSGEINGLSWVAIADGHGANLHFRSDVGATIATSIIKSFASEISKHFDHLLSSKQFQDQINAKILDTWCAYVDEDLLKNNLESDPKYLSLSNAEQLALSNLSTGNPHLAYGTTLIASFLKNNKVYSLQCGDGTTAFLTESGKITFPITTDIGLVGSETHSLSEKNVGYFKTFSSNDSVTENIYATFAQSDGWDNSIPKYNQQAILEKNYRKISFEILTNPNVSDEIKTLVQNMATFGSQDDVSFSYAVAPNLNSLKVKLNNLIELDMLSDKLDIADKSFKEIESKYNLKLKKSTNLKNSIDRDTREFERLRIEIRNNKQRYNAELIEIQPLKTEYNSVKINFNNLKKEYKSALNIEAELSPEYITQFNNKFTSFKKQTKDQIFIEKPRTTPHFLNTLKSTLSKLVQNK